jgi:hypothetical protein
MTKRINLYGKVGSGKSTVLSELDINKSDITFTDFKDDAELRNKFNGSKIFYADWKDPLKTIDLIKNEILFTKPKCVIIDEAQVLIQDDLLEYKKELLSIVESSSSILILSSQYKILIDTLDIKHYEVTDLSQVQNVKTEINKYIKELENGN